MLKGHKPDCKCCICKGKRKDQTYIQQLKQRMVNNTHGRGNLGVKRSIVNPNSIKALSDYWKINKKSEEHKNKIRRANTNRKKAIYCSYCNILIGYGSRVVQGKYCQKCDKKAKKLSYGLSKLGNKNPMWIDGKSHLPYTSDWRKVSLKIKQRDNYTCQVCGLIHKSNAVHHIDYDKTNNDEENLITLCNSCHAKTTMGDRNYWQEYFDTKNNYLNRVSLFNRL